MTEPEHQIQRAIAQLLDLALPDDCIWFAVPNGEKRDRVTAARLVGQGVKPGVPDIILVSRGQAYGLEVKTSSGRLSDAQVAFHGAAKSAGMPCLVVRSVDEVERVLRAARIPLKARSTNGI